MFSILNKLKWIYQELGLKIVQESGPDAWLIILCRFFRMLAYGANSVILALFFSALEFSDSQIGIFMTLTLLGDVFLSGLLALVADRLGRRRTLLAGALLMVFAGVVFSYFENFWLLLFAAVVGVISATGTDSGPFRAIEESTLSHLTTPKTRADVLAWYVTTASVGSAIGAELSGRIVHFLQNRDDWTLIEAYHGVFWMYSGMGILNIILMLMLSDKCEMGNTNKTEEADILLNERDETEQSEDPGPPEPPRTIGKQGAFAQISRTTLSIMFKLWFLLIVDSIADGMVGYPLTIYYMDQKFDLTKSALGDITSVGFILASCSTIFAGPLSRRLGLINTMVFTHLPSSTAVLLFPAPQSVILTVVLFFVRLGLNNMDQAPRSAFIAAVVKADERTAVMGITNMLRTLAATAGPTVTGILADNNRFWIAFVTAGALRIAYDLGLFAMFVNMDVQERERSNTSA